MNEKHNGKIVGGMEVRVWLRLLSCSMTIEKRLRRNFAKQFDTTLPRFDVMAALARSPEGQTMGDLSQALLVSNGNVTAIVRQLAEQGLVRSETDPKDRRSSIVFLSNEGHELFQILARAHHGWIEDAFKDFPEVDQLELLRLLAGLKESVGKLREI